MVKKNKYLLLFALCLLMSSLLSAQSARLKRANRLMDELNYMGAIDLYNQVLKDDDNAEAKIKLAECYRKISDTENGEFWYSQVVLLPESEPIHNLFYGQMLQRNGKCEMADEFYQKYIQAVPSDARGEHLARACAYEEELKTKNKDLFKIQKLNINSNVDDFVSGLYSEGLIFASERDKGGAVDRVHTWTGHAFLELYEVSVETEGKTLNIGTPKKFDKRISTKFHESNVAFSPDESVFYFTRNNFDGKRSKDNEGITRLKVYEKPGDGKETGLPFNSDEYSVAHPTISADGNRMYFSSDMPGGFGGMDLYVSESEGSRWGPPTNLGPAINTEGNEVFPYIQNDDKMYFASDGHIGIGGLDIYSVDINESHEVSYLENLGYPINTEDDDFGLMFTKEKNYGFFSSDRKGGDGRDDIYYFKKEASPVEVYVYDAETEEPIDSAVVVNACNELNRATNRKGLTRFDVRFKSCCEFTATKEGYEPGTEEGCVKDESGKIVRIEIPLHQESQFDLEGIVLDEVTKKPIEGALISLVNDCNDEEEPFVTDAEGKFFYKLKKGCCYTAIANKGGYTEVKAENLCTKDLTEPTTLAANIFLRPEGYADNFNPDGTPRGGNRYRDENGDLDFSPNPDYLGETDKVIQDNGFDYSPSATQTREGEPVAYLLHIYYDFDKANIRREAEPELQNLLTMLENNPDFVVEIGAHTDSRGSNRYNQRLSQRRAESVVKWLTRKGISSDRLIPRGYGETLSVNQCVDNIPCTEREHQLNRRTEFRVLNCSGCNVTSVSEPKADPKVDPCVGCPF